MFELCMLLLCVIFTLMIPGGFVVSIVGECTKIDLTDQAVFMVMVGVLGLVITISAAAAKGVL